MLGAIVLNKKSRTKTKKPRKAAVETKGQGQGRKSLDGERSGKSPIVGVRLSAEQLKALDAMAKGRKVSRSVMVREIVEKALGAAG